MTKSVLAFCTIIILATSAPASAQLLGDTNCNGWAWEVADIVLAARLMIQICDMYPPPCPENSDFDGDGRGFSIGDFLYYFYYNQNPPQYPRNPESDTLAVESTITHPGETIALAVTISSVDTIMGFQFFLEVDPDYLVFDSLIAHDNFQMRYCDFNGDVYCRTYYSPPYSPAISDPGTYHICDLILTVNPDINQPDTTALLFSSIPFRALYSGIANSDFFLPVFVDAEIEIVPLTGIEDYDAPIPGNFEISVYPNPFNDALNISVISDHSTGITVYDILGRPVRSFAINAGKNLVKWDATNASGEALSAGIYFIGNGEKPSFEKISYLK